MKSTILLTTALFLASAPSPDSTVISEFSAGFLVPKTERGLMASEAALHSGADTTGPMREPTNPEQVQILAN